MYAWAKVPRAQCPSHRAQQGIVERRDPEHAALHERPEIYDDRRASSDRHGTPSDFDELVHACLLQLVTTPAR
jgi:hypothetical protein